MKYIFIAHSHTIFLTSCGVIHDRRLPHEDVIFLFTRNYRTSLPLDGCREVYADEEFARFYSLKNFPSRAVLHSAIRDLDRMVEDWTGGSSFEVFVPHLWSPFFKLLQTHRLCRRASFVQEGAFTVRKYFHNDPSIWWRLKRMLSGLRHWGTTRFYGDEWYSKGELRHQDKPDAYGIYPEYFRYLDCHYHNVRWPETEVQLPVRIEGPVFVFDGFVTHHFCSREFYLACCKRLIAAYAGSRNYIKFHPAQSPDDRQAILSMFDEIGVEKEILDDNFPFECYILSLKGLTVAGFGSSLLYFSRAAGHQVFCHDKWLMEDALYAEYHAQGVPLLDDYFSSDDNR